jgi:hypothetical protein
MVRELRRVRARRRLATGLLTWADRLLLYVLAGAALVLILVPRGGAGEAVRITGASGFERTVPLDSGATVRVPGPLGVTEVRIDEEGARVVSSPCPHRLCIEMGVVDEAGESVVCAPNGVVVAVVGGRPSTDAVTR